MDWQIRKLNLNIDTVVPSDKKLMEKYLTGLQLLIGHKETFIKSGDYNYLSFLELYEKVEHSTLLDFDRAYIQYQMAQATTYIKGCTAECGVYKGGGSVLIAKNCADKKHYAMDTFEGFPDIISDVDIHESGGFSDVSFIEVQKLFADYKNIVVLKGSFSQSFKGIRDEIFSFVHIDADLYNSTIECCDFFYSRLSKGGIMLFDDYLVSDTPGVKKAVDMFFAKKDTFPIVLPTCQAMVFKL
jgi:hypothetical protein